MLPQIDGIDPRPLFQPCPSPVGLPVTLRAHPRDKCREVLDALKQALDQRLFNVSAEVVAPKDKGGGEVLWQHERQRE